MPSAEALKDQALKSTRQLLAESQSFRQMPLAEQKSLFGDVYRTQLGQLEAKYGLSHGMAGLNPLQAIGQIAQAGGNLVGSVANLARGPQKASDLIDDSRHTNKRIDQAGQLAGDFIDEVDFPAFVRDLLKAVFDANLEVTVKQMEAYQKLLKTATASISKFVNAIDNTAAFGYLAENQSDDFGLGFDEEEKNEDGSPKVTLVDKEGNKLAGADGDIGDNELKAKIMDAKIAMAKEHRALLRETILMGITRLVVKKGVVKAACKFDIKAGEKINKSDKAAIKDVVSNSSSLSTGGGLFGSIIGNPRGGHTRSSQKTKLSVSSATSAASTDLSASVTGSVEIEFMSDYFKLDNFAAMYAPQPAAPAPGAPVAAAPALPAPAAPAR